jgi:hypothetical protein
MVLRAILGILIGSTIGGFLGYLGQCSGGS